MMENDKLLVLVTGGTFDKNYNILTGELYFKKSHVEEMLNRGRSKLGEEVETLLMIDSLYMDDSHRQLIVDRCANSQKHRIVITHGTDTMVKTAKFLAQSQSLEGKTIVFTGAIIPYSFGSSDGLFNLGSALAFAQTLPSGIYIAMNGRFFDWDKVRKNVDKGYFESYEEEEKN